MKNYLLALSAALLFLLQSIAAGETGAPVLSSTLGSSTAISISTANKSGITLGRAKAADNGQLYMQAASSEPGFFQVKLGSSLGKKRSDGTYEWPVTFSIANRSHLSVKSFNYKVTFTITGQNGKSTQVVKTFTVPKNV